MYSEPYSHIHVNVPLVSCTIAFTVVYPFVKITLILKTGANLSHTLMLDYSYNNNGSVSDTLYYLISCHLSPLLDQEYSSCLEMLLAAKAQHLV